MMTVPDRTSTFLPRLQPPSRYGSRISLQTSVIYPSDFTQ
jgi:hypothetical protein